MGSIKKVIIFSTLIIFSFCGKKTNEFIVKGNIKIPNIKTIYLTQVQINGLKLLDSTTLDKDGNFKLTSNIEGSNLYSLVVNQYTELLLVNDVQSINVSFPSQNKNTWEIKGSYYSVQLNQLSNYIEQANSKINALINQSDSLKLLHKDTAYKTLKNIINAEIKELENRIVSTFNKTDHTGFQFYILAEALRVLPPSDVLKMTKSAMVKNPNNELLNNVLTLLEDNQKNAESKANSMIGQQAPEIELNDINNKPFALSSLRGKYVLIDFWASWCGPCRKENPNVLKAFRKFKDNNFTVLGVSLDRNRDDWVKAIYQDTLIWKHISDLKFWDSKVVPLYNISGIPYNVLIDTSGKILATGLYGKELEEFLEKQFQK